MNDIRVPIITVEYDSTLYNIKVYYFDKVFPKVRKLDEDIILLMFNDDFYVQEFCKYHNTNVLKLMEQSILLMDFVSLQSKIYHENKINYYHKQLTALVTKQNLSNEQLIASNVKQNLNELLYEICKDKKDFKDSDSIKLCYLKLDNPKSIFGVDYVIKVFLYLKKEELLVDDVIFVTEKNNLFVACHVSF